MWLCLYLQTGEASYCYSSIFHVITNFNACLAVYWENIPHLIFSFLYYWTLRSFAFLTESSISATAVGIYFLSIKNIQLECEISHLEYKHYSFEHDEFSLLVFLCSRGTKNLCQGWGMIGRGAWRIKSAIHAWVPSFPGHLWSKGGSRVVLSTGWKVHIH